MNNNKVELLAAYNRWVDRGSNLSNTVAINKMWLLAGKAFPELTGQPFNLMLLEQAIEEAEEDTD
jgi:hypothetical protein